MPQLSIVGIGTNLWHTHARTDGQTEKDLIKVEIVEKPPKPFILTLPYWKGCYNLKFGPQVRSSDVDHKIIDTGLIKAEDPKVGLE